MTPEEIERYNQVHANWALIAAQRATDISTNLPSWDQVSTACEDISNLAEAKLFLKRLSRVVYWMAKNSDT